MWKTLTSYGDKKLQDLRLTNLNSLFATNLNPLFEIKLHKFIWSLYPKDLLSNIYNLIQVYNVATPCSSLVDSSTTLKGLSFSTQNSKIKSLNKRSGMMWHFRLSQRDPFQGMKDLSTIYLKSPCPNF